MQINILNNEFMALYAGELLPPLKLHYKDFSEWQNSRRMQKILKTQRKYWQQEFLDEIKRVERLAAMSRGGESR